MTKYVNLSLVRLPFEYAEADVTTLSRSGHY